MQNQILRKTSRGNVQKSKNETQFYTLKYEYFKSSLKVQKNQIVEINLREANKLLLTLQKK